MTRQLLTSGGIEFSYIRLYEQKGPAAARNRGWLRAKGELILFTDDDCIPAPDWLHIIWKAYVINGRAEIAFAGKVIPVAKYQAGAEYENARLLTANCACSKAALIKTGGFDERFKMAWREDNDLEFQLIENHIPVLYLENAIVTHPLRKAQWTNVKEQKKKMYNALLFKKFPGLYREKIGQKAPLSYYLSSILFVFGILSLFLKDPVPGMVSLGIWLLFVLISVARRLSRASFPLTDVPEVAAACALVPFVSIFWQWYGAFKYRVLFI